MVACTRPDGNPEETHHGIATAPELSAIDSLMWQQPDSALTLLLPCFDTCCAAEYDRHYANLLLAELLYKNYEPQKNRVKLQAAVAYFDSLAQNDNAHTKRSHCGLNPQSPSQKDNFIFLAARTHYINGVGYYEMDSAVPACKEYIKALEIMENRFTKKDFVGDKAKFMALTYSHLTTLFSDFYLQEQAVYFGKQALEYYQKYDATPWHIAWILNEMGSHYEMMENYDSAKYYYYESLMILSDTNNLTYRDIATHLAILSYKKERASQFSLNRLHNILSRAESEKEYLARCLSIGEIYYLEQQFDSAWQYFGIVYERTGSVASKKLAAKRLLEICNTRESSTEISKYAAFVAQFATASENQGTQNSELVELYRQYLQNKAERIHAQKNRKTTVWMMWIVGSLVVFIVLILTLNNIVRSRNKKLLVQKQAVEKQLEAESYSHKMKQEAIGGRLKKSNEALRLQKEETEKLLKALKANQRQTKWGHIDDLMNEEICKEIMTLLCDKKIKREAKSNAYPELHLSNSQLSLLSMAVEKHFSGFGKTLADRCPKISRDETNQCLLYLLNLEDVQIAALLSCDYSTVKRRSSRLKKAFGTEKELRLYIRELVL